MLLTVGNKLTDREQRQLKYYGQEKNTATYNLARMNLILHGVRPERMTIKNGDTLAEDWPEDPKRPNQGVLFDAVVMNPPYSLKDWNRSDLKISDPRFEKVGVLPPSSKGDYAFLLHGLYHLSQDGVMTIVLPHGVLFRGGTEGQIRRRLLERNNIDTVIGMPSNLFTNTGIPVVILVLKKNRPLGEPVLFIDSSENFTKEGKTNKLRAKDIAKIVDVYTSRKEVEGFSHLASYWDELKNVDLESDFNVLRDSMLEDIKSLLGQQNFIDFYEGYEIMSNAWDQNIKSDLELIGDKGFYVAGRSVEPNYVTKGSGKKRFEVQQGSKGSLIPNDLIAEKLCQSEVETVKDLEMQAADIQSQYDELVEEAKVEDSPEYDALYDYIQKNEEDEPKNAFVKADVVKALKNLDNTPNG